MLAKNWSTFIFLGLKGLKRHLNSFKFGHTYYINTQTQMVLLYKAGISNANARHHSPITAHDTFHTEAKTGEAL